ncbi:MAG: hypothetical protein M3198_18560, partial [Actinomycetota bacterium]|nr:hypothetical protein [Actinomycetota bacterium]
KTRTVAVILATRPAREIDAEPFVVDTLASVIKHFLTTAQERSRVRPYRGFPAAKNRNACSIRLLAYDLFRRNVGQGRTSVRITVDDPQDGLGARMV